jgi:hypothetical protein
MFRRKSNKDERESNRFYLLPGMGGTARRRKHNFILGWAVIATLAALAFLGALMYWLNHSSF